MAAFVGVRDVTLAGTGGASAVAVSGGASGEAFSSGEGSGLPYSPAKMKAASRGRSYYSLLLLLPRVRKLSKVPILLAAGVVLAILLLVRQVGPLMGWSYHPSLSSASSSRDGYTVLINTWKRDSLLKKTVAHYASCPKVDAIHVVWSEPDPPSESLKTHLRNILESKYSNKPYFQFNLNEEDDLNNRFKLIEGLKTDAIFSVDDDVIVRCSMLEFAFTVWQTASDTMVGFVPRMHWLSKEENGGIHYKYGGWWSVWWTGTYSMILSKTAFFHQKYLDMYTHQMPSAIREYVRRKRNCEDIAMSLLVANATRAPPIWVKGRIYEIGSFGISSLEGHIERRTKCLNDFISLYESMPLVSTSTKAVDARQAWFW
ncbi:glycosylinositol phosphorylceramide mannosyl transferase 1-like [Zingiber officinale]|uniref:glycosylinositol phosphorylceramide mannosyl transferase 1-like n=1 Tax=Zingiber officinale TaxID=94328 RepID=UPI001C4C1679|nr:glycosylinositol phosphorylceramide mannosyl transferase 1-like [Zingiber officinale]XP_042446331.1 glycosylinositol phosphorylceramide mannosyl transferase 1-like [Zingiber officinale]